MKPELNQRIRLRFEKKGNTRFLSHHDLIRLFERVIRMADIPIRITSGFNPHPRISFPLALALGIEGRSEIVELELSEWMAADQVSKRISELLPQGMQILSARAIPPRGKSQVRDIIYEIDAPEGEAFWQERIESLLSAPEIVVERSKGEKKKSIDIRPFILDICLKNDKINIRLEVTGRGTARIEEILQALLGEQTDTVHRRMARSRVNLIEDEELRRRHMRK